jgi:D-inositol-3-phosphate glycosyltransferase
VDAEHRPLRIAFFDYVLDPATPGKNGLSDLVWNMASPLADMGDDVTVIGPYPPASAPDPRVHVIQIALPPLGYRNIVGHAWIIWRGSRALSRLQDVDVVHTPEYVSPAVFSFANRGLPLVVTEPGNIFERVANGNPYDALTTFVYKRAARRTARRCARLIATSEEMGQWWAWTGVPPDRIYRLPLGVDMTQFRGVPDAKQRLGFDEAKFHVTFAARLSRENGASTFVDIIARLRADGRPIHAHVLGSGPEERSLRDQASAHCLDDVLTWHGWVPFERLPEYYSATDAFVFTGLSGGTPRVLIQAMACGTPVIASRIGGIVDHVADGKTGILCDARSVAEFAHAVGCLEHDPDLRNVLAEAGRRYVDENLSWAALVQRLHEDVYRMVQPTERHEKPA